MRPLLITASLLLLIALSLATGVIAADWPFWQRAWRWHVAGSQAAAELPGAHRRIVGAAMPTDLPLDVDPAVTSAMSSLLDDEATQALLVARGDRVLFEYYGAGADAGTRFDGRALSALPLVALYGAAIAQGLPVSLDAPVRAQLPGWDDARGDITPRLLLQGLSGLEVREGDTVLNPFGKHARLLSGPNFAQAALRFRQAWPAGSHFAANPADAQLAAVVLARASGRPLTELMRTLLAEPLGMDTMRVLLDRHRGAMAAHCCVQARARDWLTLGLLIAQRGEVAGRRIYARSFADEIPVSSPVAPARALGVERVPVGGQAVGLLAAAPDRLLLVDGDSGTAWLWFSRRALGDADRDALQKAAASAAARQSQPQMVPPAK